MLTQHPGWNMLAGGRIMVDKLKMLRVLNKQLQHIQNNPNYPVACMIVVELKISYELGNYKANFSHSNDINFNGPNWFEMKNEDGEIYLLFPENYILEFVSFLYECHNNKLLYPKSELIDNVLAALNSLKLRWIPGAEPLSERMQQRLLGELSVIRECLTVIGSNIINSWDSDGRALHDFEHSDYIIEAKATTTSPEKVGITSLDQLQDRTRPTFLSVTNVVKTSQNSSYFYEIVEEWLSEIKEHSENDFFNLKILLNSIGYNTNNLDAYRTKWKVNETRLLPIGDNTPLFPLEFSNKIPKEVEISGYRLLTEHFESINFKSIGNYLIQDD